MKTTLSYLSSFESFEIAPRVFYGLLLADIIALSLAARAFGLL